MKMWSSTYLVSLLHGSKKKKIPLKNPSKKILIHMFSLYWSCFMLIVPLSLHISSFAKHPSLLSQNPLIAYSHTLSNLLATWDSLPEYSFALCLFFLYSSYLSQKQSSTFSKMALSQPKMLPYSLCFFHSSAYFHNLKSHFLKLSNFSYCTSFLFHNSSKQSLLHISIGSPPQKKCLHHSLKMLLKGSLLY